MPTFIINKPVSVLFFLLLLLTPSPSFALSFPLSFSQCRQPALYLSHYLATRVADHRASRGDFKGSARAQTISRRIQSVQGGLCFWKFGWNLCWDYVKCYASRDVNLSSVISDLDELHRLLDELSLAESGTERVAWVIKNYNRIVTVSRSLFDKLDELLRSPNESSRAESDTKRAACVSENYNRIFTVSRALFDNGLSRAESDKERVAWVSGNYNKIFTVSRSLSIAESDTERVAWFSGNYNRIFTVSRSLFDKLLSRFQQSAREIIETMQKEVIEGNLFRDFLEVGTNDLKGLITVLKDIFLQYSASASSRTEL